VFCTLFAARPTRYLNSVSAAHPVPIPLSLLVLELGGHCRALFSYMSTPQTSWSDAAYTERASDNPALCAVSGRNGSAICQAQSRVICVLIGHDAQDAARRDDRTWPASPASVSVRTTRWQWPLELGSPGLGGLYFCAQTGPVASWSSAAAVCLMMSDPPSAPAGQMLSARLERGLHL
jgi:hypothetical protein